MPDYQPVDLSALCNAGLEVLNEKTNAPIGEQSFRGLPFQVNDDPANCFIAFGAHFGSTSAGGSGSVSELASASGSGGASAGGSGGGSGSGSDSDSGSDSGSGSASDSGSVIIPINSPATGVILAHRLLESDLMEGGQLGKPVADYVFRLAGGEEVRVPIRERFEIAHISLGGKPFVALPDHGQVKMRRHGGSWGNMGRRQTEVTGDYSQGILPLGLAEPPSRPGHRVAGGDTGRASFHHRRPYCFAGE